MTLLDSLKRDRKAAPREQLEHVAPTAARRHRHGRSAGE